MKRALELLRNEGVLEFSKRFTNLAKRRASLFESSLIKGVWNKSTLLKWRTFRTHMVNKLCFSAIPSPYKPIYINPNKIKHLSTDVKFNRKLGQVLNGTWDKNLEPVESNAAVKGIIQRFKEGKEWNDTIYVDSMEENYFSKGKSKWGYSNREDFINNRCEFVDELYNDIKNNGYTPEFKNPDNNKKDDQKPRQDLDPLVLIGRSGEVIWSAGFHRYAIARVTGIKRIPVLVLARHKIWQEFRDDVYKNGLSEEHENLGGHPDLQDVLN